MRNYRKRALDDHLRSVPIFASLTQEFIDSLRDRVELVRYSQGDVICRQGDVADSFYLVRIGFVKVSEAASRRRAGAGLSGARRILRRDRRCWAAAPRTATCTALDHVEVVRISRRRLPPDDGAVSRRPRSSLEDSWRTSAWKQNRQRAGHGTRTFRWISSWRRA